MRYLFHSPARSPRIKPPNKFELSRDNDLQNLLLKVITDERVGGGGFKGSRWHYFKDTLSISNTSRRKVDFQHGERWYNSSWRDEWMVDPRGSSASADLTLGDHVIQSSLKPFLLKPVV